MIKLTIRSLLVLAAAVLTFSGCAKKPYGVTPLQGPRGAITEEQPSGIIDTTGPDTTGLAVDQTAQSTSDAMNTGPGMWQQPDLPDYDENYYQDPAPLKSQTVYFNYDSSAIKKSEQEKLKAVTEYMNANLQNNLLIEGHCDERGTEEYNRSLGERRALAAREYLINSGVGAARVMTRSYGEDRPVDPGHDEAAWSLNRRAEFIVLVPKG